MNRHPIILLLACLMFSCGNSSRKTSAAGNSAYRPQGTPASYAYAIVNTYPHSERDYTQGLLIHDSILYEGTGTYGGSKLRSTDLRTGRVIAETALPRNMFGEGIALLGDKIYQLTWQEERVLVYDARSLKKTGEMRYAGEGWGLTSDGEKLYMSDGSDNIYVMDPASFSRTKTVRVRLGGSPVRFLNELEWIDGKIWANVYTSDQIVIIDPQSGDVSGVIDMRGLLGPSDITPDTDVLNGIAYDSLGGKILVTGKNWNKMFEIELIRK